MASPLDLLLPPRCALCARAGPLVCPPCLCALPLIGDACLRCGAPAERPLATCAECRGRRLGFASARAVVAYEHGGRRLVHRFKDGGLRGLAGLAAGLVCLAVPPPAAEVLTWVPPDGWRTIGRGYHPPELLARELAARWNLPAAPLLRAAGRRRPQRGLDPKARRANVRRAFRARDPAPSQVVLIDDVYTTGATLSACADELRRAGASSVTALSLARAVRK
jgi:predicted amidophosphoribosyltransferase